MNIKIKKTRPDSVVPSYAYPQDAAFDLHSVEEKNLLPGQRHLFFLGFQTEIPKGYAALIWDKSSLGAAGLKTLGGVIDSTFRGEWSVNLQNLSDKIVSIKKGQKIAQALIQKVEYATFKSVEKLSQSERGEGAYGSSGR